MKIIIADKAKKQILRTAKYIQGQFGKEASMEFRNEIQLVRSLLRKNPNMGPEEPLLTEASVTYRSIVVNHLNKIVYWINNDVIEIVDFWDCRREPQKQAEHTMLSENPKDSPIST